MKHYYNMSNMVVDETPVLEDENSSIEVVETTDMEPVQNEEILEKEKAVEESVNKIDSTDSIYGLISDIQYLTLRENPSKTSQIIGMLKKGDIVLRVSDRSDTDEYIKVRAKSSTMEGFIPRKYFQNK